MASAIGLYRKVARGDLTGRLCHLLQLSYSLNIIWQRLL
ncbi:hypothetical protein ACVJMY_001342 [Bradyrhizobium diazoefficiens]